MKQQLNFHRKPPSRKDPPLLAGPDAPVGATPHGFDVTATGLFTIANPNPTVSPFFLIYKLPQYYNWAEITRLAIEAEPWGTFYNSVTWLVSVAGSAMAETVSESSVSGVTADTSGAGLRWVGKGSLEEPMEVKYLLSQNQELRFVLVSSSALNNSPLTVRARAIGSAYL